MKISKNMAICAPCEGYIPQFSQKDCNAPRERGGIPHLIVAFCDAIPDDICDYEEWQDAIDDCRIRMTPVVMGSKSENSDTTLQTDPFREPEPTGGSYTVSFRQYGLRQDDSDIDFWNWVWKNQKDLVFSYTYGGRNDRMKEFQPFTFTVSEPIEEDGKTERHIAGTFTVQYQTKPIPNGIAVPEALYDYLADNQALDCETDEVVLDMPFYCDYVAMAVESATNAADCDTGLLSLPFTWAFFGSCSDAPTGVSISGLPAGATAEATGLDETGGTIDFNFSAVANPMNATITLTPTYESGGCAVEPLVITVTKAACP